MIPDVSLAIDTFSDSIRFTVVTKVVIDYQAAESQSDPICFDGVLEPIQAQALLVKPEGERNWKWWTLWTDQKLVNDWIVCDENGIQYRVVKTFDWSGGGYQQYELVENVRKIT